MKTSTNKLALKAGTWYVISNFLIKGIAIFTTPIFTRMLSPEAFGITHTYTSWLGIFTIIGTLDIYSCVQIARHDYSDEEIDSFISSILTISSFTVFALYIAVKLLGHNIQGFISIPEPLIDIMFLEILFTNAFTIMQTKHKAYFRYKEFILFSALIAILSPIFAIVLMNMQESNFYYGKIVGSAIPKLAISIVIFFHIMKKGQVFVNKKYWKYALAISIPLIPHHLAGNILSHFDKIMINKYAGAADTGLYSLAYSYALILSVIWSSFNQAWIPWFYEKMKHNRINEIKIYVKPYIITFTVAFIGMVFVGPEALRIFGPEEYWSGKWVIPPVLLGILFQFVYSLYVNIEFYFKKTNYIAIGTAAAAIINIGLNYLYIPRYGYIAAAYTTLIGYIFLFIFHLYISSKWIDEDIFDKKFVFSVLILMVGTSILGLVLYDLPVIRYAFLLLIIAFIILKYYRLVIKFIKNLRR